MRVFIATPATRFATQGNQVTSERWAGILRDLGHQVTIGRIAGDAAGANLDGAELLVALHAKKSAGVVERFHRRHPGRPVVVALTGTDLYGDVADGDEAALRSLDVARRLITLHPAAPQALPASQRPKATVIVQSAVAPDQRIPPLDDRFEVCVSGHLRPVKDPFRTAEAVRLLPAESRVHVTHIGGALDDAMAERARAEAASNRRYAWLGEVLRGEALRLQARARLLVISSRMEGGANVVTEALAASVPVVSTAIDCAIGLLGEDYPGYFPVGDTAELTRLLMAAETNEAFYGELRARCEERRHLADPARERRAWLELLEEL
jgi:putative glycosyltransferase (TIGR04348 family)